MTELLHVTGHVTNNDGVGNGADRAQDEGRKELEVIRSRHNLTHTEDVESGVQQHQVLLPKGVVALVEALVGLTLQHVHEVHVLHPALLLRNDGEPNTGKDMDEDEQEHSHHDHLEVNLDVVGQIGSLNCRIKSAEPEKLEQTQSVEDVTNDAT